MNACPVGGEAVGNAIAEIMGVEAGKSTKMVAFVRCQGDCDKGHKDYDYYGVKDCGMMPFVPRAAIMDVLDTATVLMPALLMQFISLTE